MQTEKKKILVIDDSMLTLRLMQDILKSTYEVIISQSGEEGIQLTLEHDPDLVLLDIEMSGVDGFQVLRTLKENPKTEPIPVIFLTSHMDSAYEEKGFMEGAVDYIVKPYNINIVKARVKTHVTLYNYRRQIERQLNIDTLTDVYNRRGLQSYIMDISQEMEENGTRYNCVIIDIDYFKQVNDTYGHLQGDHVLQAIASILKKCVKEMDGFVARYGGEEFVAIVLEKSRQEMEVLMAEICKRVEEAQIPNENSKVVPFVTVSAGGAGKEHVTASEMLELIKQADEMLYKSKEEGRNRYSWYEGE